ncbi:tubulin-specific chaperone C, partial [Cyclospora cayetanensis]|uniref:Tubulin-specific chaperone C n=1 Tax=Cyclospora cayetanensis TaxID=88456 RepID=A0A6P6RS43_9EIME
LAATAETEKRVNALISRNQSGAEASELTNEILALQDKICSLSGTSEVSVSLLAQQQTILNRSSEALAKHQQQIALSRPFSFQRQAPVPPQLTATSRPTENDVQLEQRPPDSVTGSVLRITGLSRRVLLVGPGVARGREVWLKDLEGCTVYIVDQIPCARLDNIRNSAILTTEALFAAPICRLRICLHDSWILSQRSPEVSSRPSNTFYNITPVLGVPHSQAELQNSGLWRDVKDFGWIKRQQSPNWRLLEGPEPRVYPLYCDAIGDFSGATHKGASADEMASIDARISSDLSEVTAKDWRLKGIPRLFSVEGLAQHPTAAKTAAAIVAESLLQPPEQPLNMPGQCGREKEADSYEIK